VLGVALIAGGVLFPQISAREPDGQVAGQLTLSEPSGSVAEPPVRLEEGESGAPSTAAGVSPKKPKVRAARAAGVPLSLVVPGLDIDVSVLGISSREGVLFPPDDPQTLGWWSGGAQPGAARGGALIVGHTVHTGGGAFDDLDMLRVGDKIRVRTPEGVLGYAVSGVVIYRKASLAEDAHRVFSQSVPGRLVLVTCEDWNGQIYLSNVVVFADLVDRG